MTQSPDGVLRIAVIPAEGAPTLDGAATAASIEAIESAGPDVRAVLITHPGKNFCLGGNVAAFAGAEDPGPFVADEARDFHALIRCLVATPLPVVVAVQGWAAGAGMSIVALADVAIAGENAKFRAAYPGIGFTPDGGMSWSLPRSVGRARALDIILTNRAVDAAEAERIGLVSRVVADADLQADALAIAVALAAGSAGALAGIKSLVNRGVTSDLESQLDAEADSITARAASPDGREGVRAFVERRPPQFGPVLAE